MTFMESSSSCCPTETYEKLKECSESIIIIRRLIDDLQNKSIVERFESNF